MDKPREGKEWWKRGVELRIKKLPQEIEQGSQVPGWKSKLREKKKNKKERNEGRKGGYRVRTPALHRKDSWG